MRISVTRIGQAVPDEFAGTVRAVWRNAFAISLDEPSAAAAGVVMVTAIAEHLPMSPAALALGLTAGADFRTLRIAEGDRVVRNAETLVVRAARGGGFRIVATTVGAAAYDGRLLRASEAPSPDAIDLCSATLDAHSRSCGELPKGVVAAVIEARGRLARLCGAAAHGDCCAAEQAAQALIGLGPGLTPSGDDMLCGFMLGRRAFMAGPTPLDETVGEVARAASGRTTDVSAAQLRLAADGLFGEALLDVAGAMTVEDESRLRHAIDRALGVGSTSGADGMSGLIAACPPQHGATPN